MQNFEFKVHVNILLKIFVAHIFNNSIIIAQIVVLLIVLLTAVITAVKLTATSTVTLTVTLATVTPTVAPSISAAGPLPLGGDARGRYYFILTTIFTTCERGK